MVFLSGAKGQRSVSRHGAWSVQSSEGRGGLGVRGGHLGIRVAHSLSDSSAAPVMV